MKILFYADTVFGFGGVQRVLAVVAKALAASHDVTILTTDDTSADPYGYATASVTIQRIEYHYKHDTQWWLCKVASGLYKGILHGRCCHGLYEHSFFLPRYKGALINAINAGHYDAVIGVHAFFSLHIAAVRRQLNVPKAVAWLHNSYDALFTKEQPYLPLLEQFFLHEMRRMDEVVVLSRSDLHKFTEAALTLNSVASTLNLKCIYNPLTVEVRGKGGAEHKRFIAVGRFSPRHKGFDILIEAFARFARTNDSWTLEIVGEGEEETLYRQLIAEHRLESRVKIHHFTADIQSHYATSSVFILSSRWEGFGLVIVEAMAHGLPVIASRLPVVEEIIAGSEAAMTFPVGDVVALADHMTTLSTTASYDAMSAAAIRRADAFALPAITKQWEEVIEQ